MSVRIAVALTRWWTHAYTIGLPADVRAARCAEIDSDIWESLHDPDVTRPRILPRLAAGVIDDVSWRATFMADETRTVWLVLSTGSLLLLAMWEWLARPAVAAMIAGSTWIYPIAESLHVLGITVLLGLTVMVDARLLGISFRRVGVADLVAQTLPWIAPAALLSLVTGMLLFVAEPARFAANPFFQAKVAALGLAVINVLVFHCAIYSRVSEWGEAPTPPLAARLCAAGSLVLWAIVLIASRLVAYNWFGS